MFSNGADVNLNKVYRSSSAASTEFTIGELYRQTGSNATFKFVELGAYTHLTNAQPTVVQGTILAHETGAARAWDGQLITGNIGTNFAGVAQNTEAVTNADTVDGVTVCIWAQVAGKSVSNVSVLQAVVASPAIIAEVGLLVSGSGTPFLTTQTSNGLAGDDAAGNLVGDNVANVLAINPDKILATFDGATAAAADFQNIEVGDAITPNGASSGNASTVNTVYKDRAGVVRGLVYTVNSGGYVNLANHVEVVSSGTDFGNVSSIATAGNVTLNGAY